MGSSLPIILHIFSTLFPSPSVFFFHSFFSGPYSLPLPLIFSLPTFFFLPSLFSFSSFLSPYFPHSSPYLLSRLLSFLFLPFPSFCALFFHPCHVSVMPPLPHPPWAPFSLLITFFPSSPSIPPSSTPSLLSLLPSFPTSLTLAYHAVFFCTPRLFLLKPRECMLVHSLLNYIAAAWWHEAI